MKALTLENAFDLVLENDYYWTKTGRSPEQRRFYRNQVKTGKGPTLDTRLKICQEAGFSISQPMLLASPVG